MNQDIFSKQQKNLINQIKNSYKEKGKPPQTSLDFYKLVKLLGKGSFGKVHLGKEILTDKLVAIKCIDKIYMKNDFSRMKILQEVLILKKLVHVNIIRLLEVFENC
jgi:serine/threonine protein kinase